MKTNRDNTKASFARLVLTSSRVVAACFLAGLILSTVFGVQPAYAAVYTWDNGTGNLSGPTDGTGAWSLSSANWWNGSGYQTWPNGTDTAQFGFASSNTNSYTVTLDPAGVNAGGIVFQDQAYTLSGSTLTLGGGTPTVTVNAARATISSFLGSSVGLVKAGPGLLTLTGPNTYTGAVTISSGSLQISGNTATINTAVTGNGTLILGGVAGLVSLNSQPANNGGTYINGGGNLAVNTTLSLSGSNILTGEFYSGNAGGAGDVTVSSGTFNIGRWFEIGRLFGSTATNSSTSSVTITGPGTVVNASTLGGSHAEIGWADGSGGVTTGILNVLNGGRFDTKNQEIHLGVNFGGGSGQVGTIVLGNSSTDTAYINTGNANTFFGDATGSTGNLTVNGGSLTVWDVRSGVSGTSSFTLNSGYVQATGWYRLGINAGSVGTYVINGGVLTNSATSTGGNQNGNLRLNIGENGTGTFTLNGGLVRLTNTQNNAGSGIYVGGGNGGSGIGTLNVLGGTLSSAGPNIFAGAAAGSSGTINVSNAQVYNAGNLVLANGNGATGALVFNSGLFQANTIRSNSGAGTLYFGSGTLQITGNAGYIGSQNGGTLSLFIGASPATIDTNGNTIQALVPFVTNPSLGGPDGGLTKLGAGILALSATGGQNTFQGPTTVSAGTLLVSGGFTSTSGISMATGTMLGGDGSTSGVTFASGGTLAPGYTLSSQAIGGATPNPTAVGTISPASLTLNGGVLSFKLSNSASSGNDQINVTGNVSLTNVTFNISNLLNGSLQSASYDLLNYGSSSALSGLTLTGLPLSRQTYALDTTSSANMVLLDVSAASPANLIWLGTNSTTWDTTTQNWFNTGASAVDKFFNLDNVSFTDQGAAHGNITVSSSFTIGALNVSLTSASSSYTFSGPGYLQGVAGLVMSGSGSVTVNTPNKLTGETDLHGGSLTIGGSGAIGDASGINATNIAGPADGDSASVTVNGGTLSGTSISMAFGNGSSGTLNATGGLIQATNGNFLVSSSGTGSVSLSGNTVLNVNGTGAFSIADSAGSYGSFTQGGNSVVTLGNTSAGLAYASIARAGSAIYTLNGGTMSANTFINVGDLDGSSGSLIVNGGLANINGSLYVGKNGTAQGIVNQTGGSVFQPAGNGNELWIGMSSASTGTYNISAGSLSVGDIRTDSGTGFFNQTGGTVTIGSPSSANWLRLGVNTGANAIYNLSGSNSVLFDYGNARIGEAGSGTLNVSGNAVMTVLGRFVDGGGGGSGLVNIGNNTVLSTSPSANNAFSVGDSNIGSGAATSGTLNITGGFVTSNIGEMWIGNQANNLSPQGNGTVNLSAGALTVGNWFVVGRFGATGVVNMTGGSLTQQTNGNFDVAVGAGAQGTFNQSAGTVNVGQQLLIPENGDTTTLGTYNLSGSGLLITNSWLAVGRGGGTGVFNFSAGTLLHTSNNHITVGSGGAGLFNMTGGLLVDSASSAYVGENSDGTLSIAGGTARLNQIEFGLNAGHNGTVDLTGGLLSTTQIFLNNGASTATLHLGGGTLQAAGGATTNFISGLTLATLDSGTTTFDTNGNTVAVAQSIQDGGGSGGLLVKGNGQLTLSGTNTYLGNTTVTGATLIAATSQSLPDGANLTIGNAMAFPAAIVPPPAAASVAPVPEPGTLALVAGGAVAAFVARRRFRRRRAVHR
jgi:fibronectin-binding autotransporter adhesin